EAEVPDALSHLEKIGVLQQSNRMDVNELLNPENEDRMYDNGMEEEIEEEIYNAVVERHQAEEEMNSGNDRASDNNPFHQEMLSAASTILNYVSDIDDPFAHKLETILVSFGCQTRLGGF
ncbi:hypothetical protein C0995_008804, partial [Termitomyces sp. Mi166